MVKKRNRDADREVLPDAPEITETSKHTSKDEDDESDGVRYFLILGQTNMLMAQAGCRHGQC